MGPSVLVCRLKICWHAIGESLSEWLVRICSRRNKLDHISLCTCGCKNCCCCGRCENPKRSTCRFTLGHVDEQGEQHLMCWCGSPDLIINPLTVKLVNGELPKRSSSSPPSPDLW